MQALSLLKKTFFLLLFFSLLTSCRLGEVMSEADPATNMENDPAEKVETDTVVTPKKDDLKRDFSE